MNELKNLLAKKNITALTSKFKSHPLHASFRSMHSISYFFLKTFDNKLPMRFPEFGGSSGKQRKAN